MSDHYEQLDVLIVGAGISGLGTCYNLKKNRPYDSFAVIEGRENIGGTWDLFKYPGIRSDSDMYTFAYSFKPWKQRNYIASGDQIKQYLHELVTDEGLEKYIRFQQKATSANWDSNQNRWLVTITRQDGSEYYIAAKFLTCATGYYDHDSGYVPKFEGYDDFTGTIAHPQHWPEELDYTGKKVLVIGSGATAVTLAPTMSKKASLVTMLQRSPTYIASRPASDALFRGLSKILPAGLTNKIMRAKYIWLQQMTYLICKGFPNFVSKAIRKLNIKALAGMADVDVHFNPSYKPWDQRLCMTPDNDLFNAIRSRKLVMETDHIERFTETGVLLKSGKEIEADIIVPATGLDMVAWGKMKLSIDGQPVEANKLTNYKGMMFSQMPNFMLVAGYTNLSWTLKAELTYGYLCRLLDYMDDNNHQSVYPYLNPTAPDENSARLQSGYVLRALDRLPKQGSEFPWCNKDLYIKDIFAIKSTKLADGILRFDDNAELAEFHHADLGKMNVQAMGKTISKVNSNAQTAA